MITGEIKNKIDSIWDDFFSAGMSEYLTVIEQFSYLMFIHSLDEVENETEQYEKMSGEKKEHIFPEDKQKYRWHIFKTFEENELFTLMNKEIFPFIKKINANEESAFARYMKDATFSIPSPQTLKAVITKLDELFENPEVQTRDMLGDIYEYVLSKMNSSGQVGMFRTPKQIRDMMVQLIRPQPMDTICDPACGTAGFLISSAEFIRDTYGTKMGDKEWEHYSKGLLTGFDTGSTMLKISAMNLLLHSIHEPHIAYQDSVSKNNEIEGQFDIILANPPFTGSVNKSTIAESLTNVCSTTKTELLFVALFIRMLKKGGRCACIVPDGVLFGSSNAHKALRKELVENHQLAAVISMPSGVFKPYAGVSTGILVFTKTGAGGTDNVWFYDMKADGYSLDDKRQPTDANDIPDIIKRFQNLDKEKDRKRTEQSFFVPKSEIVANNYDLSINKYKEVVYEKVEYPAPKVLIGEIKDLQKEISSDLIELEKMLNASL